MRAQNRLGTYQARNMHDWNENVAPIFRDMGFEVPSCFPEPGPEKDALEQLVAGGCGGQPRPLPHQFGRGDVFLGYSHLCRCADPEQHGGYSCNENVCYQKAADLVSWATNVHELLDYAGKDCISQLEMVEIRREWYRRDHGNVRFNRMVSTPYDIIIRNIRNDARHTRR